MFKLSKQNEYSKKNYCKRGDGLKNKKRKMNKKQQKKKLIDKISVSEDFIVCKKNRIDIEEEDEEFTPSDEDIFSSKWDFKKCKILSCDPFLIIVE
jgi:hypothetical protein